MQEEYEIVDLFTSFNYDLKIIYCTNERRLVNLGELSRIPRELSATEYGYIVEAKIVTDLIEHQDKLLKEWIHFERSDLDRIFGIPGGYDWKTTVCEVTAQSKHNGPVYDFTVNVILKTGKKITIFINVKSHSKDNVNHFRLCSFKEFVKLLDEIKNNEICVLSTVVSPLYNYGYFVTGKIEVPQKHMIEHIHAYNVKWASSIKTDGTNIYLNVSNYPKLPDLPWRYHPNPPEIERYYGKLPSTSTFEQFLSMIEK